jgi:DNA-binding NarL/FixJ family response regulator
VPVDIVGEALTIEAARGTLARADAFLVAAGGSNDTDEDVRGAEPLTARELDVLQLLAEGLPNKAIALRLGISDQTVKFHVASIYGKLSAANRTEAVRLAIRRGLITI